MEILMFAHVNDAAHGIDNQISLKSFDVILSTFFVKYVVEFNEHIEIHITILLISNEWLKLLRGLTILNSL